MILGASTQSPLADTAGAQRNGPVADMTRADATKLKLSVVMPGYSAPISEHRRRNFPSVSLITFAFVMMLTRFLPFAFANS